MTPFIAVQIRAIIEDIRLLESFVTAPLGLYSDIKMLREALPFPEAAELTREETQERRASLATLTQTPQELTLGVIASLGMSLSVIEKVKGDDGPPLEAAWLVRARRVLARAEQRVAGEMRAKTASRVRGLYVIVDPEATRGRPVLDVAEAALKGGASVLQLRDKTHDKGVTLPAARQLKALCDQHGALFIMNDHADLAASSGAHGLHVGQTDLPVAEARRTLAPHQLVGRSNNTVEEAMESQAQGVDYLAVGAVYPTSTMGKGARHVVGVEMVSKVKGMVAQPVVAIGGINAGNIAEVVKAGADCICVVSAVTLADDPQAATRALVKAIQDAK
jgi:thiamine-phosphate pyrophosphorylase